MNPIATRCLATVTLGGSLREKLGATAAAGFDAVELAQADLEGSADAPATVRRIAGDLGLRIDVYQPLRDVEGVPAEQWQASRDRADLVLDCAAALGARTLLVCSNTSAAAIDDDQRGAAQLHDLAERAVGRSLAIGFEALSWGTHVNTYRRAWRLVKIAAHRNLGLIVDSFHTLALQDDPALLESIPAAKILLVQLADALPATGDLINRSRHLRCLPGDGVLDVCGFLRHVQSAGYAGAVSLEVFSDKLKLEPPRDVANRAMLALRRLEDELAAERAGVQNEAAEGRRVATMQRIERD